MAGEEKRDVELEAMLAEYMQQFEEIAESLAHKKIRGLTGACGMMFIEVFRQLLGKGVLSQDEFEAVLRTFEADAASNREEDPIMADTLGLMTFLLQQNLGRHRGSSN